MGKATNPHEATRSRGPKILSLEGLILWAFRRLRPQPVWRRKNGRRWVLQ